MLETLDRGTLRGLRDRAVLLLGFAGGLRRSEIVGLDVWRDQTEDGRGWVDFFPDKGVLVTLRGKAAGAERLNDQEVARLVKRTALAAGMRGDLSEGERGQKFAGHSLRAGSRLLGRGQRALCAKAARSRVSGNDAKISAPQGPSQGQGPRRLDSNTPSLPPARSSELVGQVFLGLGDDHLIEHGQRCIQAIGGRHFVVGHDHQLCYGTLHEFWI